jgi:antitoxin ParD1/3/4
MKKATAKTSDEGWPSAELKVRSVAQAKALRKQAKKGGLRFDAYLPPWLAEWLTGLVERGTFLDPSEAVFVILGEHQDLEPHADLRRELLKRRLKSAIDDPRPGISGEELSKRLRRKFAKPQPEPAVWRRSLRRKSRLRHGAAR